jgi:hypothetical protein
LTEFGATVAVGNPVSWISDTFSASASEDDLIQNRSLNITRIGAVVAPLLLGTATAIGELAEKAPWNEPTFQRQLLFVVIVAVTVMVVADMLARALVSAAVHRSEESLGTILPTAFAAILDVPDGPDLPGNVVAFRTFNARNSSHGSEYLFVPQDGTEAPRWVGEEAVHI